MKLLRLDVRRMPGFPDRGFSLPSLGNGLNLIIGPNASGKTTICRAIRGLLWPETLSGSSPVSLLGVWRDSDTEISLDLEGNRLTCQREGAPAEVPPLPGSHLANCFTVTIDDLFDGSDSGLAERIAQEMAGGYDLKALRGLDCFRLSPRAGRKEEEARREARRKADEIRAQQEKLRGEEDTLARLEQQAKDSLSAQSRLKRFEDVRELLEVQAKIAAKETVRRAFPPEMERLRGNEGEQLKVIREDLAQQEKARGNARAKVERARAAMAEAALPEGGIPQDCLREQGARLERLRDTERDLADAEKRLAAIEEKVRSAAAALGEAGGAEKLDAIDLPALDDIESLHRRIEGLAEKRRAAEAQIEALGEANEAGSVENLSRGIGILRDWFEAGAAAAAPERQNIITIWVLAGVLAAAAVVLAATVSLWWSLLVVPGAVAGMLARMSARGRPDGRGICRERYARLSLAAPVAWDVDSVAKCIRELEELLAAARLAEQKQAQRRLLEQRLARLDEEEKQLAAQRQDLNRRLGVEFDTSLPLVVMAGHLRLYQESRVNRDGCRAEVGELRCRREREIEAVNRYLGAYGIEAAESAGAARVRTDELAQRATRYREAATALAAAESSVAAAEEAIGTLAQRRRELLRNAGLDDAEESELDDRLARLGDWQAERDGLHALRAQAAGLIEKLKDEPELPAMTQKNLDEETGPLKTLADSYRDILEKIADIRTRVDRATQETRLTEALAEQQRATAALAESHEKAALAAAGRFFLDEIEADYEAQSQPAVLRHAATWFGQFGRGRYELKVDRNRDRGAAFYARDTTSGLGLPLAELSRGTRMQLLLAVRLAFAAAAERGTQLPFVLDEVLSSTDPVRFRAITECLLALVREGRQVFYFTCQPGDAQAWHEVAERTGVADAVRIDLAAVRGLERAAASPLDVSTIQIEPVLDPGDMDMAAYVKALGVPALEPAAGAGAAHLAYLVDQPDQLHTLLKAGISTFGQLRSLASQGPVDAFIDEDTLAKVRARGRVLDAFCEAWGVGRGKPLSREVLAAAGVSENFIDRIAGLACELKWDTKRLVDALERREDERAKGFRRNSLDAMRESLIESGHLDPTDPLDETKVLERILAAANEPIKSAVLSAAEVKNLFARFRALCKAAET